MRTKAVTRIRSVKKRKAADGASDGCSCMQVTASSRRVGRRRRVFEVGSARVLRRKGRGAAEKGPGRHGMAWLGTTVGGGGMRSRRRRARSNRSCRGIAHGQQPQQTCGRSPQDSGVQNRQQRCGYASAGSCAVSSTGRLQGRKANLLWAWLVPVIPGCDAPTLLSQRRCRRVCLPATLETVEPRTGLAALARASPRTPGVVMSPDRLLPATARPAAVHGGSGSGRGGHGVVGVCACLSSSEAGVGACPSPPSPSPGPARQVLRLTAFVTGLIPVRIKGAADEQTRHPPPLSSLPQTARQYICCPTPTMPDLPQDHTIFPKDSKDSKNNPLQQPSLQTLA